MAEQNIIEVAWNVEAFDLQTQAILKSLNSVYDSAKNSPDLIKPGSAGGYTELKDKVSELNKVQTESLQLTKLQEQAEQARLKTQKATADALISEARLKKLTTDATQKLTQEQKLQQTITESAAGSYKQLSAQYRLARLELEGLSGAERNSAKGLELRDTVLKTNTELKIFDADIGNYQRNVGNYNSSLGRLSKGLKGLGGLGILLSKAIGIDPEVADGIREAGRAIRELQHARELQEVGIEGSVALYEKSKEAIDANTEAVVADMEGTTGLAEAQTELSATTAELVTSNTALEAAKTEVVAATTAQATSEEGFAGILATSSALVDKRIAEEIALADAKYAETTATVTNTAATEGAVVAQEDLAVATVATSTAMKTLGTALKVTGIIALLAAIGYVIYEFVQWREEMKKDEAAAKLLNDTLAASKESYSKAIADVSKLREEIKLAKEGFIDKKKVVEEYNDSIGKTTGLVKTLDEAEQDLNKNAEAYIKFTFLKSVANEANSQSAKKAVDAQLDQIKDVKEYVENTDAFLTSAKVAFTDFFSSTGNQLADVGADLVKKGEKTKKQAIDQANNDSNALAKIAKQYEDQAAALSKQFNFNFFQDNGDGKEDHTLEESLKRTARYHQEALEQIRKANIDQLAALRDKYKAEAEDQTKSFSFRLGAESAYAAAGNDLIEKSKQDSIKNLNNEIANDKKASKSKQETAAINELAAAKLKSITNKAALYSSNFQIETTKLTAKIITEELKKVDEEYKRQGDVIKRTYEEIQKTIERKAKDKTDESDIEKNNKLIQLDKDLQDGKISSLEKYDAKRKAIEDAARLREIQIDEDRIKELEKVFGATADLRKKYSDDEREKQDLQNQKKDAIRDAEISSVQSVHDLIVGITDDRYEREIAAIEKVKEAEASRYATQKEAIANSTLSAQEKTAQTIALDKQEAENKKKLNIEESQIKRAQAKFDRDAAILGVTENAAVAIFKALQVPVVGEAEAIAIGVQAATQIALILSKPLPAISAFGEGTDYAPGGPAIVGEKRIGSGYQKELVTMPGGSFITDGPMLMNNLPKGSKVKPLSNDDIMVAMQTASILSMGQRFSTGKEDNKANDRAIIEAIENGSRMTVQAMKKQRGTNVSVIVDGRWGDYITKTVKE